MVTKQIIDGELYLKMDRVAYILIAVMLILIFLLTVITFHFVKNLTLIKSDPFVYGAVEHGIDSCSCYSNGTSILFDGEKLIEHNDPWPLIYNSDLDLS